MDSAFGICYTAFRILDSGTPLPKEVKEILEETKKENNYDSLKERLRPFFNQLEVLHQEEIKKKEKELNEKKMSVNNKMKRKKKRRRRLNQQINKFRLRKLKLKVLQVKHLSKTLLKKMKKRKSQIKIMIFLQQNQIKIKA